MECTTQQHDSFLVVTLSGEVDMHHSPQARTHILLHLMQQQHVLVDLSRVSYIDSSGIASLVEGFQLARSRKLRFGLVGVSHAAMQVLALARLDKVLPIKNSVSDYINT